MNIVKKPYLWMLMMLALVTSAQAADLKIGYVNAARLLDEAPQANEVSKRLKQEFAQKESLLLAEQKDLKEMEDRFARDSAIMSEVERRNLERDIVGRKRDLRRSRDDFREDLNIRRNEEIGKLLELVQSAIETIGKERNFDLIVYEGIAYASAKIDLTNEVLERLRKAKSSNAAR